MKLLLDENLPKKLKWDFNGHEISTVSDMKWKTTCIGSRRTKKC